MMGPLAISRSPSESTVTEWIGALGVPNVPVRRKGVATFLSFVAEHMPQTSTNDALSFLRCIDLTKTVTATRLRPGEILVAYRHLWQDPLRLFYTRKGFASRDLGINTTGKVRRAFRVTASSPALESRTTAAIDTWSPISPADDVVINPRSKLSGSETFGVRSNGGGTQLMIPYATCTLECLNS